MADPLNITIVRDGVVRQRNWRHGAPFLRPIEWLVGDLESFTNWLDGNAEGHDGGMIAGLLIDWDQRIVAAWSAHGYDDDATLALPLFAECNPDWQLLLNPVAPALTMHAFDNDVVPLCYRRDRFWITRRRGGRCVDAWMTSASVNEELLASAFGVEVRRWITVAGMTRPLDETAQEVDSSRHDRSAVFCLPAGAMDAKVPTACQLRVAAFPLDGQTIRCDPPVVLTA